MRRSLFLPACFAFAAFAFALCQNVRAGEATETAVGTESCGIVTTDEDWKSKLTPEQYQILRKKGTERAFTGRYHDHHGDGLYKCAGCGAPLFDSKTKFESGTGWPSFYAPVDKEKVATEEDNSHFMKRTEVLCASCGGHLGHVFPDGPEPTGLRYCINSAALEFEEK